jgi:prevent-host-death family protein
MQINICQAKAHLAELLERAVKGEEVIIARSGKPIARLSPIAPAEGSRNGVRLGGLRTSRLKSTSDFHGSLTDEHLLRS